MTLVIMAAGMGSRYGGLKQVDPIGKNGEFIIDYSIFDAVRAGFDRVVFIIKEENYQDFHDTIGNRVEGSVKVEYAFQRLQDIPQGQQLPAGRVKPWGTAHAVLSCEKLVGDPFMVINADDFYGREAFEQVAAFLRQPQRGEKAQFCMAGYVLENTLTKNGHVARGVCEIDAKGNLERVTERVQIERRGGEVAYFEEGEWHPIAANSIVSMNCWGFTPAIFPAIRAGFRRFFEENKSNLEKAEYYLPSVVQALIRDEKCDVAVLRTQAKWFGVTYREDRSEVVATLKKMVEQKIYPERLWQC